MGRDGHSCLPSSFSSNITTYSSQDHYGKHDDYFTSSWVCTELTLRHKKGIIEMTHLESASFLVENNLKSRNGTL